jgi:hypothetical protein
MGELEKYIKHRDIPTTVNYSPPAAIQLGRLTQFALVNAVPV